MLKKQRKVPAIHYIMIELYKQMIQWQFVSRCTYFLAMLTYHDSEVPKRNRFFFYLPVQMNGIFFLSVKNRTWICLMNNINK